MAPTPTRPRQVTLAGWLIVIGSAVVVFSAFDRVAGLRSIESQETVEDFLSKPPGEDLGLTVGQAIDVLQAISLVAAGCATAAGILGIWVLKGSKQARLALAVLAVPLLVTGLATGGLMSSLVAVAAVMLWLQPARHWFEGKPPPEVPVPPAAPTPAPSSLERPAPEPPQTAVPWPPQPPPYPGYPGSSMQPGYPAYPGPLVRPARPPAVVGACILTWVCTSVVVLALGATVAAMLLAPDVLFEELHRQNPDLADQGLSDSEIETATYVSAALFLPWCAVAAFFAIQAIRRRPWARLGLMICASLAAAFSLVCVVASVIMVVPFVASVVTVALLARSEVRAWYAVR
jgi:hypothetical protein